MTEKSVMIGADFEKSLFGRRKICTNQREITEQNVVEVLSSAMSTHRTNSREIDYLYDVYRGKQKILSRHKDVRPSIDNRVVVNHANEIVSFKVSYLLGEPLQYVSRGDREGVSASVDLLNEYMFAEGKAASDKAIAEWAHICGVAYRLILPDPDSLLDDAPFTLYDLDPREAFVIHYSGLGKKPLAGVILQKDVDNEDIVTVYTDKQYFKIKKGKVVEAKPHFVGGVPVVEYLHNEARMGAFEVVLSVLGAINTMESDRTNSVEDFVQAYDVFQNCEIDEKTYRELTSGGQAINVKSQQGSEAKVYRIASELDQNGVQTAIDDLYSNALMICGMPAQQTTSGSTSDTGKATIMRNGWYAAEARAKDTETLFKKAERETLKLVLRICAWKKRPIDLKVHEVEPKFTRRNYEDIQSKAQVLVEMLNNSNIHPKLAFQTSGMFSDAENAYKISMDWAKKNRQDLEKSLKDELSTDRQSDRPAEREGDSEI